MTDLIDHFRPEIVEALERFVDERIAQALDPEPVLVDDVEPGLEGEPDLAASDDDEPVLE